MLCYDQDVVKIQLDECCQGLSRLIQDQLFLTSMVHALEEEKSFTIKDKSVWHSVFYVTVFVLFWWGGVGVSHWWCTTQDYRKQPKWMIAALILSKIKTTLFKTCSHVKSSLKEKSLPLSKCKMKRCLFWWKYKWCKPLVTHRLDQKTCKGACTVLTKIT